MNKIKATQGIGLPLIALGLDLISVVLYYLGSLTNLSISFILLLILFAPIAGMITGVVSLIRGKGRMGIIGKVIAIVAVALPTLAVLFILFFFVGVMTGLISLM